MKKRIGVVLVLLGCLWSLCACGSDETTKTSETTKVSSSSPTQVVSEKASSPSGREETENGQQQVIVKEIVIDENQPTSSGENVISQEIVI